jgi:NAD(P)-dependent dehydrogenase (short-subunit alcohol dehydrogenase family)
MTVLTDKVIVIIGGTSGIGLSAAKAFIAAGGRIVVLGNDKETSAQAEKSLGASALVLTGDATDQKAAAAAIQVALGNFKRFDGLYHVAGGSGRNKGDGPLHELSDDGWEYTLNLNLASVFYSNRAATQQFIKQQTGGSVLNLSSVLAFSPSPHFFHTHAYAAAKAGIIGLTKSAAAYYAPAGIRFNVLAPAVVATPMSQRAQSDPNIMQFIPSKQPLDGGRIGQPGDLDAAAAYFLSNESRFVTGQVLSVDGGWSVSEGQLPVQRGPEPRAAKPQNLIRTLAGIWARLSKS